MMYIILVPEILSMIIHPHNSILYIALSSSSSAPSSRVGEVGALVNGDTRGDDEGDEKEKWKAGGDIDPSL